MRPAEPFRVSAWQHPTDRCTACEQDILLRPEITPDLRLLYVRYCPRCDASEPVATPRERVPARELEAAIWGANREPAPPREPIDAGAVAANMWTLPPGQTASRKGMDLWWDGDADRNDGQLTGSDARWARFAAGDRGDLDDEDETPLAADGTFAFGGDNVGKRRRSKRRSPLRLRQSA